MIPLPLSVAIDGWWLSLLPHVFSTCLTYSSHLHCDVLLNPDLHFPPNVWLLDATMLLFWIVVGVSVPIPWCAQHFGHLG